MSLIQGIAFRIRSAVRRRVADTETRSEIAYHLECATRSYRGQGFSPTEARRRAVAEFGGADAWRDAAGDARSGSLIDSIWRDARFATRTFRRRPGFVTAVVSTLALGIGASTAMFSLVSAVFLRPVPARDPDGLVAVYQAANLKAPFEGTSFPEYKDLAARSRQLSGLAAVASHQGAIQTSEWSDQVPIALVSGNYFSLLGLAPAVGRLLTASDEGAPGATPVLVISYDYWKAKFGGAESTIGQRVRAGTASFTIVGVAPRGFHGTDLARAPDAWFPVTMNRELALGGLVSRPDFLTLRGAPVMNLVGRMRAGARPQDAAAELNGLLKQIRTEHPIGKRFVQVPNPISVIPLAKAAVLKNRDDLVRFVQIILGTVALTLLLACVSVANLLLVRGADRSRELGLRYALGASGGRVLRQLFVENIILALSGGAAGLIMAWITMRLLSRFTLPGGVVLDHMGLGIDARALAFTLTLSGATACIFGVAPAVQAARRDLITSLRGGAAGLTRRPASDTLVALQVAISLVLLVGASLFIRSVRAGLNTDIGIDPRPLIAMDLEPRYLGYTGARSVELFQRVLARAVSLPGVTSAAATQHIPLAPTLPIPLGNGPGTKDLTVGSAAGVQTQTTDVNLTSVTRDFFKTVGLPVVEGRGFLASDDSGAPSVIVVNRAMARAFWPGQRPVGKQVNLFGSVTYTVVGVVPDGKYASLSEAGVLAAYEVMEQDPLGRASILVRSTNPRATIVAMRGLARELNAILPVMNVRLVSDQIDIALMSQRFAATLLTIFGLVALGISTVGLYGTVAYAASRRTAEIGIRVALGASRGSIAWLLSRHAAIAVASGLVAGAVGAIGASKTVGHFVFGIKATDPAAFVVATLVLGAGAVVAALIPARKGASVDPVKALRAG